MASVSERAETRETARELRPGALLVVVAIFAFVGAGIGLLVAVVALGGGNEPNAESAFLVQTEPETNPTVDGSSLASAPDASVAASAAGGDTDLEIAETLASDEPFVQATLTGPDLVLLGTVPSSEVAEALDQRAALIYSPFFRSELEVNSDLDVAGWIEGAPDAIALLQTIVEGTMLITQDQISVTGTAASSEDVSLLEERLVEATGLPVTTDEITLTDLREAVYVLAGTDGQLALSGALPSEEIHFGLVDAAIGTYGEAQVFDASTVDQAVAPSLWMYNPAGLIDILATFPEFEVRFDGAAFSAVLSGGPAFEPGSVALTPELERVLDFGVVVLSRDPAMTIEVEGHTDSEGSAELNTALSQQRADAVSEYLQAAGVEAGRITAVGRGEDAPVADNTTAAGRARNRRIEFTLQSIG